MHSQLLRAALALAIVVTPLSNLRAQVRVLTFEGLTDQQEVGSFYSGVTFTSNAFALVRGNLPGGSGNFGGEPSPGTALVFSDFPGEPAFLNVAAGFTTGFSLFYSAPGVPGMLGIFSGLNGTGTLLGSVMLPVTPFGSVAGCPQNPGASFCPFAFAGTAFSGTARSVNFGATLNDFVFDDVTLGRSTMAVVPEPSTVLLTGVGLLGVIVAARRRQRSA